LLTFHPKYLIMLSATIKRKDGMDRIIRAFAGEHSIIRRPEGGNVVALKTGLKFEHEQNKHGGVDWSKLNIAIHNSEERNEQILDMIAYLAKRHEKIMIATIRVEHALYLYDILSTAGYSVDFLVGNKKTFKDSQIFIGGHKKVGKGFDQAMKAENFDGKLFECLLNVSSIKDEVNLQQLVGRLRNLSGTYYQILDNDSVTKSHFSYNKTYFKGIGAKITEINLYDYIANGEEERKSHKKLKEPEEEEI
ncbi:MAG: hypothetical protein ACRCU2_17645, partial [Planktothrix sp.]